MAVRGQVKWFDPKKGYGFIIGPAGQDVFVHYSQIQGDGFRSLKDGEAVEYELVQADKGFQARGVQRVSLAGGGQQAPPGRSAGYTNQAQLRAAALPEVVVPAALPQAHPTQA